MFDVAVMANLFQSRLAGFLFFYRFMGQYCPNVESVSIPSGGIFVFLLMAMATVCLLVSAFQSRLAGFLFFYEKMVVVNDNRREAFQSRLAGFLFFYEAVSIINEALIGQRFNPVWRDFCFSTPEYC